MQSPSSDANSMMQLLQRDFLYNLSLLRERDAELERYDLEVVVLREELEKRDAACHGATGTGTELWKGTAAQCSRGAKTSP